MTDEKQGALQMAVAANAKTQRKTPQGNQSTSDTTKNGYDRGVVISALQKAIRRGMEPEALYWGAELMESQMSHMMWRRLFVIAAEDVGLADPDMVMRIWTMKQAHDVGREMNIPFLAIMLLCRSPKNREADDAAYYYEERRKKGWKMKIPPEAVDGHTREGRGRIYRIADKTGENWETVWCREFYYDAALLKNYQPDTPEWAGGNEDPYRRKLMEFLGLPYRTYDVDTCPEPRILTGQKQRTADEESIMARIPKEPSYRKATTDEGEVIDGVYLIDSFTTDGLQYRVDTENDTCECPAFQKTQSGTCKHLLLAYRLIKESK